MKNKTLLLTLLTIFCNQLSSTPDSDIAAYEISSCVKLGRFVWNDDSKRLLRSIKNSGIENAELGVKCADDLNPDLLHDMEFEIKKKIGTEMYEKFLKTLHESVTNETDQKLIIYTIWNRLSLD